MSTDTPSLSTQIENNLFYDRSVAIEHHRATNIDNRTWNRNGNGFILADSAFKNRIRDYCLENTNSSLVDLNQYLTSIRKKLYDLISNLQNDLKYFKCQFKINALFSNIINVSRLYNLKTTMLIILKTTDIDELLDDVFKKFDFELENLVTKGSGFMVSEYIDFFVSVNKFKPPSASKYIPLPPKISAKKAIINVKNANDLCFKYALLCKFVEKNPQNFKSRVYERLENKYDWSGVNFPAKFEDVKIFLKNNQNCSILR